MHGKIEIEYIIEDNEIVSSSLNINSDLENSKENVVIEKRDKDLQLECTTWLQETREPEKKQCESRHRAWVV